MNKEKYWMVQVEGKGLPSKKHHTEALAIEEAERLAVLNNGTAVFVLEAGLCYVTNNPVVPVILTEKSDDGYINWEGGECPFRGYTLVDFIMKDGGSQQKVPAGRYRWLHRGTCGDIVKYRISK